MKKFSALTLVVVLLISSCKTGNNFTSRRYTKGHYASKTYKKDKLKGLETRKQNEVQYASTKNDIHVSQPGKFILEKETKKQYAPVTKIKNKKSIEQSRKSIAAKIAPLLLTTKGQFKSTESKPAKTEGSGNSLETSALLGAIFGVLGIVFDILGFVLIVGSLEYVFMFLFVIAIAFGILGVIFGSKNIRSYSSERNVTSLVLGIVGLATGVISLVLAIYYSLWSLVWIAANTL